MGLKLIVILVTKKTKHLLYVSNKNISLEIESNNQKMIAGNLHMTFEKKSKCVINVYNSKN
jgi:hypothetical protein